MAGGSSKLLTITPPTSTLSTSPCARLNPLGPDNADQDTFQPGLRRTHFRSRAARVVLAKPLLLAGDGNKGPRPGVKSEPLQQSKELGWATSCPSAWRGACRRDNSFAHLWHGWCYTRIECDQRNLCHPSLCYGTLRMETAREWPPGRGGQQGELG